MKRQLAIYALFVYEHYIYQDWSEIKPFAQKILKPFWFVRSSLLWIYSIFCFPLVLLDMKIKKYILSILS